MKTVAILLITLPLVCLGLVASLVWDALTFGWSGGGFFKIRLTDMLDEASKKK